MHTKYMHIKCVGMYNLAIVWLKHVYILCTYVHAVYIPQSLVVQQIHASSATRGQFFWEKI